MHRGRRIGLRDQTRRSGQVACVHLLLADANAERTGMTVNAPVNILLVDDHPEGVIALEAVLKSPDYNLLKAHSGEEALSYISYHDISVILLDVQMPKMQGFQTAAMIKQVPPSK